MASSAVTEHNMAVLREAAIEVEARMNGRASWVHGLAVGIALAQRAPLTAADLRREIERAVAEIDPDESPEQTEVRILGVVDLFDRRADS